MFHVKKIAEGHCVSIAINKNNRAYTGYYVKNDLYYLWANINGKDFEFELPYLAYMLMSGADWTVLA